MLDITRVTPLSLPPGVTLPSLPPRQCAPGSAAAHARSTGSQQGAVAAPALCSQAIVALAGYALLWFSQAAVMLAGYCGFHRQLWRSQAYCPFSQRLCGARRLMSQLQGPACCCARAWSSHEFWRSQGSSSSSGGVGGSICSGSSSSISMRRRRMRTGTGLKREV